MNYLTDALHLEIKQRHLFALLLSVAAHLGLVLVVGIRAGITGGATADLPMQAKMLAIYLVKPDSAGLPSSSPSAGDDKQVDESPAYPRDHLPVAQRSIEATPILPIGGQAEVRYFQSSELTQEPLVANGLVGDKILVVSGISPQSVILQVWISDQGDVERVAVNANISWDAERLVMDAFSKVKFHPGKIGRIPVRSHLRMEILLEDAVKL